MNILSIQSHVAYGHVGNRSAVFPLERLGYEVWPVNTVQYSCNAGIPGWTGAAFGADHVADIITGLERVGAMSRCDAVLSGYVGDAETGRAILEAVSVAKRLNPTTLYCCDPVMGDRPEGLYVRGELPDFFMDEAIPLADIVCPNVFEAELLSGIVIESDDDLARATDAIHAKGPGVVMVTSYRPPSRDRIGLYVSDGRTKLAASAPIIRFDKPPKGSGDLSSALFLGYYLMGGGVGEAIEKTLDALYSVLESSASGGGDNLAIVAAQDAIAEPGRRFTATAPTG